ncbi:MAG: PaaI family thioesterase [Dehalococcoidia bacterium]
MIEPEQDVGDAQLSAAKARWDNLSLHRHLGITLEALAAGYARFRLTTSDRNMGGVHGSVHGGILAFLIDVATLAAVSTLVGPGERMAGTAELNVSYLRPALGPSVFAEARVLRKGQVLAVVDVDISNHDGKLLAKGRVGYAVRPAERADNR